MARREAASRRRCAIYTRKSTEEGLEQDFNSLDAQREACAAFIRSQRSEGWVEIATAYDDGGLSGGTLERPALQRLLGDIRAGRIDIVVVYKVDRLTRSLTDFSKLVEVFDAAGASFVSVTQQFNTASSMGRLTLNMLLSFAQFEREVTAERIRDKIAASRAKGLWMGGPVPLGYDAVEKQLVVNAGEAGTVRHIFARYLALGAIRPLRAELARDGIVSKRRRLRSGAEIGGRPLSGGALAALLRNPIYVGEVRHKGTRHPGQHEAIVDRETWEAAQALLDGNAVARRPASEPSPLAGRLSDAEGRPLTPSHASKRGVRYRYYVSHELIAGCSPESGPGWRLPALPVERAVRALLAATVTSDRVLGAILPASRSAADEKAIRDRLAGLAERISGTTGSELRALVLDLDLRAQITDDSLHLSINGAALQRLAGVPATLEERLDTSAPLRLRKRGQETKLVLGEILRPTPDAALVAVLDEAETWTRRLLTGSASSLRALARELGRDHRMVARTLPLAYLAPDIRDAIRAGTQPVELTPSRLRLIDPLPLRWEDQRRALGFPTGN